MKMTATDVKWMFWTVLMVQVAVLLLAVFGSYPFTYVMLGIAGCLFQIIAISKLKRLLIKDEVQETKPLAMGAIFLGAFLCKCDDSECHLHGEGGVLEELGYERIDKSSLPKKDAAN